MICRAQSAADPAARIRAAMESSLEAQKNAVREQQRAARQGSSAAEPNGFFTVPWTASAPRIEPAAAVVSDSPCDRLSEPQLANLINDAARREDVKPSIVQAVIETESAARPCAVSPKGAQGLMQLMPATASDLNVTDPFDAKQNVDAGTKLLKSLLTRYSDDLTLALGAYNAGAARVDKDGGVPDFPETRGYIQRILSRIKVLDDQ
jgi:soluble lytic murein transglycosylase-like protein